MTGNTDFTVGLGCYDEVFTYDELDSLPADAPTWAIRDAADRPGTSR